MTGLPVRIGGREDQEDRGRGRASAEKSDDNHPDQLAHRSSSLFGYDGRVLSGWVKTNNEPAARLPVAVAHFQRGEFKAL